MPEEWDEADDGRWTAPLVENYVYTELVAALPSRHDPERPVRCCCCCVCSCTCSRTCSCCCSALVSLCSDRLPLALLQAAELPKEMPELLNEWREIVRRYGPCELWCLL